MDKLKEIRLSENISAKQMADKLGISESLYQKLEYGVRTPSINVIKKIKSVYPEVDANIFFEI